MEVRRFDEARFDTTRQGGLNIFGRQGVSRASDPWSIAGLLRDVAARGRHPAIVAIGDAGAVIRDSRTVAKNVRLLALGLRERGVGNGDAVALWAPNSPEWVTAALAILAAGGVLMPIDDLADPDQLRGALACRAARFVFTTQPHLDACGDIVRAHGSLAILLDWDSPEAHTWRSPPVEEDGDLPAVSGDAPALLSWTSGTTGSPKAFLLTHRNIAANVEALRALDVVGSEDRALLPLPLHHAYPLVVGMLTTLTVGTTIVLPGGTTGPAMVRALREANVTAIVGVPRLYDALAAAIDQRAAARGLAVRTVWRGLLAFSRIVLRTTGLCPGRWLLAPVRRAVAPQLRLLVSGGARLEKETEERLEALGWTVLSGYGLAETASLFTGNSPRARRLGSAGRPLAGGETRIAEPDGQGIGAIELRGPSITEGYLDNPKADREAFTPDGWFRTGDLGFVDRDGFLFVTGRAKEVLVLGGGKKVIPEDLERVYGAAAEIAELALIEREGGLVALVRPDAARLRARGATNIRDGIRVVLAEAAQGLPSYQRLSGFALTRDPLPRTRLGKYRRFLLPALYAAAATGPASRGGRVRSLEDEALLRDPNAAAVWTLLRQRHPEGAIDLNANLALDLNLDSFAWMELTLVLQEQLGILLTESDIASAETVRDLLRLSAARRREGRAPPPAPASPTASMRWLAPTSLLVTALGFALHAVNKALMRGLFGLRTTGREALPATGAFVIAPNHASFLDPMAIAAALSWRRLRRLYWAGDALLLFGNPATRLLCRAMHVFPVEAEHPGAALDTAAQALRAGNSVVWFPEGWRSPDGMLQRFLPGIGELLLRNQAPAVPTYIAGAFEAWPRSRRLPRLHRITVAFGRPEPVTAPLTAAAGDEEGIAAALRQRVADLAPRGAATADIAHART